MKVFVDSQTASDLDSTRLLQEGVYVTLPPGAPPTITDFLAALLEEPRDELLRRVQTVVLNRCVVDDPDAFTLAAGDRLVLSGALPGVVGAMMRSDSPLKAMRAGITATGAQGPGAAAEPYVGLKLFNTVLAAYRERLLARGFWVDSPGVPPGR